MAMRNQLQACSNMSRVCMYHDQACLEQAVAMWQPQQNRKCKWRHASKFNRLAKATLRGHGYILGIHKAPLPDPATRLPRVVMMAMNLLHRYLQQAMDPTFCF